MENYSVCGMEIIIFSAEISLPGLVQAARKTRQVHLARPGGTRPGSLFVTGAPSRQGCYFSFGRKQIALVWCLQRHCGLASF